jgi:uncharacterized protein (TIGR00369 family)
MTYDRSTALARLRKELKRPPFHGLLRPEALDVDPDSGTVIIGLGYRDEFARAPNEKSFHGGVIATLIDIAGHAAVAIKIGKMAPTTGLHIDYLRPSAGRELGCIRAAAPSGSDTGSCRCGHCRYKGPPDCAGSRELQHGAQLRYVERPLRISARRWRP